MPSPRFTVAYALTAKKTRSFMQPKLETHARFSTGPLKYMLMFKVMTADYILMRADSPMCTSVFEGYPCS